MYNFISISMFMETIIDISRLSILRGPQFYKRGGPILPLK